MKEKEIFLDHKIVADRTSAKTKLLIILQAGKLAVSARIMKNTTCPLQHELRFTEKSARF